MRVIGLLLNFKDWDENGTSAVSVIKSKIITIFNKHLDENDYILVYPNLNFIKIDEATAVISNNSFLGNNNFAYIQKMLSEFNQLNDGVIKKLFVLTNVQGISNNQNDLLESLNKNYTQLFLIGINSDVENFALFQYRQDIYNMIEEEVKS